MAESPPLIGTVDMVGPGAAWARIVVLGLGFFHFVPAEDWRGGGAPTLGQTVHFTAVRGTRDQRARDVRP